MRYPQSHMQYPHMAESWIDDITLSMLGAVCGISLANSRLCVAETPCQRVFEPLETHLRRALMQLPSMLFCSPKTLICQAERALTKLALNAMPAMMRHP